MVDYLAVRGLKVSGTRVELVARAFVAAELNLPIIESTEEHQNRLILEYEKRLASLAISDPCLVNEPVDDVTVWPPVSLGSIFSYILKVRDFDREYVGKYKDQKAYSYFDSGFVDTILVHEPKEQNCKKFVYVYCKVTASQSVNEKKELWVVIDKKSGEVCLAWCSCMSSIEHGGTRPFFYMVDQYFGNDSLEPFECIFMAPLALFTLWRCTQ